MHGCLASTRGFLHSRAELFLSFDVRGAWTALQLEKVLAPLFVGSDPMSGDDLSHRYLWGPAVDQLLADEQVHSLTNAASNETLWALADRQGSITDMVDNNGTERLHRVFDSFGNVLSETHRDASGSIVTSGSGYLDEAFEYTGRWLDRDTGLQNNLNRWYDPRTGRFLSEDPIGLAAGDANLYRYVGNSPTNGTDPTGLWHWYSPCSWFWGDDPPANTRPSPGEHHTRAGDFPRTIGGPGHLGGIPGGTASQNYGIACRETGGLLRRTGRDTLIAIGTVGVGGGAAAEGGAAGEFISIPRGLTDLYRKAATIRKEMQKYPPGSPLWRSAFDELQFVLGEIGRYPR